MKGREILKSLEERREHNHQFVKWWRKEQDFLDYDLIERFERNASDFEELGGFELLTAEQMWNEVKRVGGTRVRLLHDPGGDKIEWIHRGKSGENLQVCDYSPKSLLTIFDVETRGNPVDS